jgi:hypothetical protein
VVCRPELPPSFLDTPGHERSVSDMPRADASPTFPLGDTLEVYVRREDAERFLEEVRGDEPELAKELRIE